MGWKIKVLTPNNTIEHWFVKEIKKNGISFSGTTCIDDAQTYKTKAAFQKLIDHIKNESGQYELIEIKE